MNGVPKTSRLTLVLAGLLAFGGTTGCWSRREINEVALVLAAGVDRTPDGAIRVTAQFPIPRPLGIDRGGPDVFTVAGTGATLDMVTANLVKEVGEYVSWSHLQLLVLGEGTATRGVADLIDFVYRQTTARETARVLVARGPAAPLLGGAGNPAVQPPAKGVRDALLSIQQEGLSLDVDIARFATALVEPGWDPVAPAARVSPAGMVRVEGLAAFRGDRLAGFLDDLTTRGYLLACSRCQRMVVLFTCPGSGEPASLRVYGHQARVDVSVVEGRVEGVTLETRLAGIPSQVRCRGTPGDTRQVDAVRAAAEETLRASAEAAVARARSLGADVFGFAMQARRRGAIVIREEDWTRWPVRVDVRVTLEQEGQTVERIDPQRESPVDTR